MLFYVDSYSNCLSVYHIRFVSFFYLQALALQSTMPMNYYTVFHHISQLLPHDCIIVSEGANTMDIGRTMLNNYLPRHRQGSLIGAVLKDELLSCVRPSSLNIFVQMLS